MMDNICLVFSLFIDAFLLFSFGLSSTEMQIENKRETLKRDERQQISRIKEGKGKESVPKKQFCKIKMKRERIRNEMKKPFKGEDSKGRDTNRLSNLPFLETLSSS